jgi:hypothetical protein
MLIDMERRGERVASTGRSSGSNQYAKRELPLLDVMAPNPLTLAELGFSGPRALRWQLAAKAGVPACYPPGLAQDLHCSAPPSGPAGRDKAPGRT